MSRARRIRKQGTLIARQVLILEGLYFDGGDEEFRSSVPWDRLVEVSLGGMTPYEQIAQNRHERRVFGHEVGSGCCDFETVVSQNQPSPLSMGRETRWTDANDPIVDRGYDGHIYRRRVLNRRRRT